MNRKVEIRYEGRGPQPWRLYWSGTDELVLEDRFADLKSAGAAAREAMEEDEEEEFEAAAR